MGFGVGGEKTVLQILPGCVLSGKTDLFLLFCRFNSFTVCVLLLLFELCFPFRCQGCCAFWCCPCFACKVTDTYGEALCLPLLDIFGMVPPATLAMRVAMRHRYGIAGNLCTDCIYASFCTTCTWCQMSREMRRRNIQVTLVGAKRT
ncbi:hypothetical protein JOB18_016844 [Solea senegalensis]|uniref:Plac8 onzin related protein 2 n=1 Tax=Solea senegalensis TaxID=28829 RepID=A0AAV6SI06_SOLSE|nr:hypothetical protein JOB18_016844 [Solea senegalensis]